MHKKLNVLFLCGWYPSKILPTNGDFIQRHAEAVALNNNVFVLHIISKNNANKKTTFTSETVNGVRANIAYIPSTKNPFLKFFYFTMAFKKLLKNIGNFDVVHLNEIYPFGIFSLYLKWFQKKKYIITEHFTGYYKTENISFFKKKICQIITSNSSFICPVSKELEQKLKQLHFKGNYKIVPNVVDTNLFKVGVKKHDFLRLVHVSSLKNSHKNIKGMLRVAKLLDDKLEKFEWNFIGNNGEEYKNLVSDLNLKNGEIIFLEHISQKALVKHLQAASICISFSNFETFGIVIPEAIACGTPVISTKTGIALDLQAKDYCEVIAIKDENALLKSILNAGQTFKNIDATKMHLFIKKHFEQQVVCKSFTELYKNLIP
ncbi:glycosyltransferase family 4 protein [uncultured Polaribacter sp.]|uniref:glycosyltransferase family 4 protein n=1 Tax=uncultured Polaribacter sp. TaxID=174711 RepID=UPI002622E52D|nr:glycosyltransferase family 4 protein [uncultured Polaribacter sp.]